VPPAVVQRPDPCDCYRCHQLRPDDARSWCHPESIDQQLGRAKGRTVRRIEPMVAGEAPRDARLSDEAWSSRVLQCPESAPASDGGAARRHRPAAEARRARRHWVVDVVLPPGRRRRPTAPTGPACSRPGIHRRSRSSPKPRRRGLIRRARAPTTADQPGRRPWRARRHSASERPVGSYDTPRAAATAEQSGRESSPGRRRASAGQRAGRRR
jgi:hypothetical protein